MSSMVISTLPTSWDPVGANPMPCWRQAAPVWQWQNLAYLGSVDYHCAAITFCTDNSWWNISKNFTEVHCWPQLDYAIEALGKMAVPSSRLEVSSAVVSPFFLSSFFLPFQLCVARKADRVAGCHICPRSRKTQCRLSLFTHPQPSWVQLAPSTHWMGNSCALQSLRLPELSTNRLSVLEELCF